MKAMILAAGRGSRLMPLTQNTPKPLIKVKGLSLIEHSINALKKANITDIIINIAYLGELIKSHLGDGSNFGVRLKYSDESTGALETAGGILKALPLLGSEPFLVINSDVVCDYDLSELSLPKNSLAHLLLVGNPTHNPNGDFSLNNQSLSLDKTPRLTFSGIGIYHPDLFQPYQNHQGKLALYPLFKAAIIQRKLSGEYYSGEWQDVGTIERLEIANHS
jgi:MurNAc alpha-1-phosphate uridylyltransferase